MAIDPASLNNSPRAVPQLPAIQTHRPATRRWRLNVHLIPVRWFDSGFCLGDLVLKNCCTTVKSIRTRMCYVMDFLVFGSRTHNFKTIIHIFVLTEKARF